MYSLLRASGWARASAAAVGSVPEAVAAASASTASTALSAAAAASGLARCSASGAVPPPQPARRAASAQAVQERSLFTWEAPVDCGMGGRSRAGLPGCKQGLGRRKLAAAGGITREWRPLIEGVSG
jgi:hypothetical protein